MRTSVFAVILGALVAVGWYPISLMFGRSPEMALYGSIMGACGVVVGVLLCRLLLSEPRP